MDRYTFDPYGDLLLLLSEPDDLEHENEDTDNDENEDEAMDGGEDGEGEQSPTTSKQIQMRASSKVLALVSPVFRVMLQTGGFLESVTLASEKQVEIALPEDDAAAFEIILNITHARTRRVPKKVDLRMLTEITILIDKYQLHEAVEVFSDYWIADLRRHIPTDDLMNEIPNLPSWLCVTWVLNQPQEFKNLTEMATLCGTKYLKGPGTDHLPIPSQVIGMFPLSRHFLALANVFKDDIEKARVKAIGDVVCYVQTLISSYRKAKYQCSATSITPTRQGRLALHFPSSSDKVQHWEECDSMMLGCLERIAISTGIEPAPSVYDGIVFGKLLDKLLDIQLRSLCDRMNYQTGFNEYGRRVEPITHGVKEALVCRLESIRDSVQGLSITDYQAPKI